MSTKFAAVSLLLLVLVAARNLYPQAVGKSHEQCIKLVPGDWGPNFGDRWRGNEARYWACRQGEAADTVRAWQKAAQVEGFIQNVVIAHIDNTRVVIVEEIQGTAHCHVFSALSQTSGAWLRVWDGPERLPGDDEGKYCTGSGGAIKVSTRGNELTLDIPDCRDDLAEPDVSCRHLEWKKEHYRWDGKTFVRL